MPRTSTFGHCRETLCSESTLPVKSSERRTSPANPQQLHADHYSSAATAQAPRRRQPLLSEPHHKGLNLRPKTRKRDSLLERILRVFFCSSRIRPNEDRTTFPPDTDNTENPVSNAAENPLHHVALVSNTSHLEAIERSNTDFGSHTQKIQDWPISAKERSFFSQGFDVTKNDFQNNLIDGWYQSTEGNCVFVAAAKASMDAYGTHVFKKVEATSDGLTITMHDNKVIKLSTEELLEAKKQSDFAGENTKLLAYATIMYAAAAKRAEIGEHEGADDFEEALEALNDGEYLQDGIHFLGLSNNLVSVNPQSLGDKDAILACSDNHAIYVNKRHDGAHIADHYGDAVSYNGTDTRLRRRRSRNRIHTAYTLKPLPESTISNTHNRENVG
jgi:hypothetical protein